MLSGLIEKKKIKQREYNRQYYARNKEKELDRNRRYIEANRERVLAKKKEWHRKNAEKEREQRHLYSLANKELLVQRNREWAKRNPEKARIVWSVSVNRRRARLRQTEGRFTRQDIEKLLRDQKGLCYYCGCDLGNDFHIDHKIPIARGGSNWPSNLALACVPCNKSKGAKLNWNPHARRIESDQYRA